MKDFVSTRITLSKEALEMAKTFKKNGSFRSLSATIEELIRRLHYINGQPTELANIQLERLGISLKTKREG